MEYKNIVFDRDNNNNTFFDEVCGLISELEENSDLLYVLLRLEIQSRNCENLDRELCFNANFFDIMCKIMGEPDFVIVRTILMIFLNISSIIPDFIEQIFEKVFIFTSLLENIDYSLYCIEILARIIYNIPDSVKYLIINENIIDKIRNLMHESSNTVNDVCLCFIDLLLKNSHPWLFHTIIGEDEMIIVVLNMISTYINDTNISPIAIRIFDRIIMNWSGSVEMLLSNSVKNKLAIIMNNNQSNHDEASVHSEIIRLLNGLLTTFQIDIIHSRIHLIFIDYIRNYLDYSHISLTRVCFFVANLAAFAESADALIEKGVITELHSRYESMSLKCKENYLIALGNLMISKHSIDDDFGSFYLIESNDFLTSSYSPFFPHIFIVFISEFFDFAEKLLSYDDFENLTNTFPNILETQIINQKIMSSSIR